ncbi:Pectinesterase inhibitor domain [Macleaya cordata]|uniref:Pectinesterase inhibitor domain n=1 Tax=Macleaya cordata TaxID=56857 RepID=A0A200QSH6_MACCD|nr:Pectinesterase inhibitor domain [Macleaya cordata]
MAIGNQFVFLVYSSLTLAFIFFLHGATARPMVATHIDIEKDDDLIKKTCKKTDYYDLCVSSLKSDARSSTKTADLNDFVMIFIDLAMSNASETYGFLNKLIDNTTDYALQLAIRDCTVFYDKGYQILRNAQLITNYEVLYNEVGRAKDEAAVSCENIFHSGAKDDHRKTPMVVTKRNELFEHLCLINQSIINLLRSSS